MRIKTTPFSLVLAACIATGSAIAETYKITPESSKITFSINNKPPGQQAFQAVPGSFKEFSGTWTLDPEDPSKNAVKLEVKTASVDTNNAQRDDHLRNPDFFKVKEFPTMSFRSTSMTKTGADTYDVKGEFTLLGKTKPLAATFQLTGPQAGGTSFRIKRSEYGMTFRIPDTADEVDVTLEIAGVK